MTVKVMTEEHVVETFDATDWEVEDDRLWVGNGDIGVAEFAAGAWRYVYEIVETPEPRVWDLLEDLPEGVRAVDTSGDVWIKKSGILYFGGIEAWTSTIKITNVAASPFTEVV